MRFLRVLKSRLRYVVAAATLASVAVIPAFASAAQVTERSIALSSSVKGATGVTYQINFTTSTAAQSLVLEFCKDSPLVGSTCAAPDGFSIESATTSDATIVSQTTANKIVMTKDMTTPGAVSIALAGVSNPSASGPLYARIVTYNVDGATALSTYSSTDVGTHADDGGVAISITDGVNVSGAVLESMTFCVAKNTITANCDLTGNTAPTLQLGKEVGGVVALDASDVYSGTIYTQISTNAASGAVVSLKSNATNCGGLIRSSDPSACDIGPAGTSGSSDVTQGNAGFGLKLGTDVTDETNGDYIAASSKYNSTQYHMNFVSGNASGVTGPYGDPILSTNSKPANNLNMPLTFAASVSNNTPAGNYSADLNLVATGTF